MRNLRTSVLLALLLCLLTLPALAVQTLTLPAGTKTIETEAFFANQKVTDVVLPGSIGAIGSRAFAYSGVKRINLPASVQQIAADAFVGCSGLNATVLENSYAHTWCVENGVACTVKTATPASDFTYSFKTDYSTTPYTRTVRITGYTGSAAEVVTPVMIEGYPVKEIDGAFINTSVTSVEVSYGVETLDSTFEGCTSLTSVTLPESLKTIEDWCFEDCTHLRSINLPDSITTIGYGAFYDCTLLKFDVLNLPESLTTLDGSAFYGCNNIKAVVVPAGVKKIGGSAFSRCLSLESVTLPEGLLEIGSDAFAYSSKLRTINMPSTLTTLGNWLFENTAITSITLPENITSCGAGAFDDGIRVYVDKDSKTAHAMATKPNYSKNSFTDPQWPDFAIHYLIDEITLEETLVLDKYYGSAKTVTIPKEITRIAYGAFRYSTYDSETGKETAPSPLETVYMHDGITAVEYNAFIGHKNLKTVYLSANISEWGTWVFSENDTILYCDKESVTAHSMTENAVPMGFTDPDEPDYSWLYQGEGRKLCAYRGSAATIKLPTDVVMLKTGAFRENKALTAIMLSDGITEISDYAFYECTNLKSVTMPKNLTTIGRQAFEYCKNLTTITLPASLTTLGYEAFGFCDKLKTAYLPDNVSSMDWSIFRGCPDDIIVYCNDGSVTAQNISSSTIWQGYTDPDSPEYAWLNEEEGRKLYAYRGSAATVKLPSDVVIIGERAFVNNLKLTSITLPEGLTIIERQAFDGCKNLTTVTFPDSLTTIEHKAFAYCEKLITLSFPDSLTTIGSNAFINCDSLKTVYLPDNVTQWDTSPFEGCYYGNLTTFYCSPGSATAYGLSEHHCAFTDPKNPTWAWSYGEDGSLYVGGYNGTSTSITLPSSAKGVKKYAFYNDEKLTKVVVPEGIEHIGSCAFYGYYSLESITLPASVNRIDESGLGWHATVSVPAGSYAESYCKENNIKYVTR